MIKQMIATILFILTVLSSVINAQLSELHISNIPFMLSDTAVIGDSVEISTIRVANTGTVAANSVTVSVYLSRDNIIDTTDQRRINYFTSSITIRSTALFSTSYIHIPTQYFPGEHYIGIIIDPKNTIPETDETNNIYSMPLFLRSPLADLVYAETATATPDSVYVDSIVSLSRTFIKNVGLTHSGLFAIAHYLSKDSIIDSSDYLIYQTSSFHQIFVGNQLILNGPTVTIPSNTIPGQYYICSIADALNEVEESIENNNTMAVPITVMSNKPDLLITSGTLSVSPNTMTQGDTVQFSAWALHNSGITDAGAFANGFYLSADSIISSSDVLLTQNGNTSLAAKSFFNWGGPKVVIPSNTAPGNYYLGILTDYQDAVIESDESNNYVSAPIVVDITLSVEEFDSENLPSSYFLSQNFPNPFNPSTTIEFNVPKRSNVRLIIYNTLGQKVNQLVDEEFSAGNYRVTWDGKTTSGDKVPSGVYFYQITAGDFEDNKKMVLLK